MPRAQVADGEIEYSETGSGHALIFVSGLSGVGRAWQPQLAPFGARYRVVTYDQRGTGGSDQLQRHFSVDQMASEVIGLMDALGIERAHVVGQSTGGAIAQTLAIEYPQRLRAVVMFSTWTHCDPWFRRLFEARRRMYLECGAELHQMFHPLFLYPPEYVNSHDAELEEERRRSSAAAPPVPVSVARIDAIMRFDRRQDLGRIRTPTLIMAAENDYITPSYFARSLNGAIPGSKLYLFDGGGHSLSKTRSEEFSRVVLDFLAEHERGSGETSG